MPRRPDAVFVALFLFCVRVRVLLILTSIGRATRLSERVKPRGSIGVSVVYYKQDMSRNPREASEQPRNYICGHGFPAQFYRSVDGNSDF